jgi:hypothetical protein
VAAAVLSLQAGVTSAPGRDVHAAPVRGAAAAAAAVQVPAPAAAPPAATNQRQLLERYCLTCHTESRQASGTVPIALDRLPMDNVAAHRREWESVVRKMRAGLMPPAGLPRPERTAQQAFLAWLEGELDRAAAAAPDPGRTEPFHRLNRTEYRYAVRDLLDLDLDVAALLPPDDASYGFDNIAGVLKLSPTLMERYLNAAQKISRAAVGTPPPFPAVDAFRVGDDVSQEGRLPGHAIGTRGGTRIRYLFPTDGDYTIRIELSRDLNEQIPLYDEAQHLEVSIDGERVQLFTLPGVGEAAPAAAATPATPATPDTPDTGAPPAAGSDTAPQPRARTALPARAPRLSRAGQEQRNRADRDWEVRLPVKAGARDVQVAFLDESAALPETARLPFRRPYPAGVNIAEQRGGAYLRSIEISGPFNPAGADGSPSRRRIFSCRPAQADDAAETACASSIFKTLARRAYRRPVTDDDVAPLLAQYREGRADGDFDRGIEYGVLRLLLAPEFLFRVEADPPGAAPAQPYRIADLELASRLSFFLWSSIPDEELLQLAERGELRRPEVLDRQVTRMLADARFSRFVEGFAGQWLFLRNLAAAIPVQQNFPDFDDTLRQAFRRETELFVDSIIREERSALDLLRADYTFVNERLADHYGIPNVKGTRFRRVRLDPGTHRAGLLGHGSILTVTSYPDRTSPVVRGKWVLENLLGAPPPPPPPDVPELAPSSFAAAPRSMRERIAAHRRSPACASCHALMDPIGLALENFDAVGRWRTLEESGAAIDASGSLPDGTAFTGATGLTDALLSSDAFVRTLTEKLLTYALGRGLDAADAPAVRAILREGAGDQWRVASLLRAVVRSAPFQMRRADS